MTESFILFLAAFVPGALLLAFNRQLKGLRLWLAFSGAYIVGLIFSHLVPAVYAEPMAFPGLWIIVGFLIQIILEFVSHGAEHGHVHQSNSGFPWGVVIGLMLHAFLEGLPFHEHPDHGHTHLHDHKEQLLTGIVIHQIPISIALGSMLLSSSAVLWKRLTVLLLFGLAAPLGTLTSSLLNAEFLEQYHVIFDCLVIGVLLHVATTILFETDSSHKVNLIKLAIISIGLAFGLFGTNFF